MQNLKVATLLIGSAHTIVEVVVVSVQQLPLRPPSKNGDFVAAARFSPFHPYPAARVQANQENYKPPQRSLFQMAQPKTVACQSFEAISQNCFRPLLKTQSSSASAIPFNENVPQNISHTLSQNLSQNTGYLFTQESLYG